MKKYTRLTIFVVGLFPLISQGQTTAYPLTLVLEKESYSLSVKRNGVSDDVGKENIFGKNYLAPNLVDIALASGQVEISVDRFFENFASSKKPGEINFSMTPVPVLYFQSEKKTIQFIGGTTGTKTEFLFLYNF